MVGVQRVRLQSGRAAPPHTSPQKPHEDQKAQDGISSLLKMLKNPFRGEVAIQHFHWKDMTEYILVLVSCLSSLFS